MVNRMCSKFGRLEDGVQKIESYIWRQVWSTIGCGYNWSLEDGAHTTEKYNRRFECI